MDGAPNLKTKKHKGEMYSETRYAIIKWLEAELPKLKGSVLDIGAGGWKIPRSLLNKGQTTYTTFDKKHYGQSKNNVNVYGDVMKMPKEWTKKWDNALCIEVLECVENPFTAMENIYRVLKPGGAAFISCPYNYRWFGVGSWDNPKQGAPDFWRITEDGWKLLTKRFSKVEIKGFGGTGPHDRFGYCIKAIK